MDEPTLGVDERGKKVFAKLLKYLTAERGCVAILVTHNLKEVEHSCNRLAIMKKGGILACDHVGTLVRSYGNSV